MAALYYVAFAILYAGFVLHRSDDAIVWHYSVRYAVFLVVLAAGFGLPALMTRVSARRGRRTITFALVPSVIAAVVLYAGSALRYYYTENHSFDPFLQAPPPTPSQVSLAKPAGTIRILALGGSTTRELPLPPGDRYPRVLEDLVNRHHPGVKIEVFNAGMDWYTTKHSLINYVTNLHEWHPDVAVVMHGINDLYRSFTDADYTVGSYQPSWSHFYGPAINGAKPPTFERNVLRFTSKYWFSDLKDAAYVERDVPVDRYVSLPDFRRHMSDLVHYLKADGVRVVLLTEPSIYKDPMTPQERAALWIGREYCKEPAGVMRYEYPSPASLGAAMRAFNDVTIGVGAAEQAPVVDVASRVPKTLANFVDDVHYTPAGAHAVAGIVAAGLDESGVLTAVHP